MRSFCSIRYVLVSCGLLTLALNSGIGFGQASDQLTVRDLVVLLVDAHGDQANQRELFQSSLPGFVAKRRDAAPRDQRHRPTPHGLITFDGAGDTEIDVLIEVADGRFLSGWPSSKRKAKRILWQGLELEAEPQRLQSLGQEHWLAPLRDANRLYAYPAQRNCERFLLYDVVLKRPTTLHLSSTAEGYALRNPAAYPLHDVVTIVPDADQFKCSLPVTLDGMLSTAPEPAATQPADTGADETAPASAPEGPVTAVRLAEAVRRPQLLNQLRQRLLAVGLGEAEAAHALRIIEPYAFDPSQMTALYRLDPAELDELMPLELTPEPDIVVRVGMVILTGADPKLADRIEQLIAQLGDDEWQQRQSAHDRLADLGVAAKPHLEKAVKHDDLEIVYRAEQLLDRLGTGKKDEKK